MDSVYGATGQSRMVGRSTTFDLSDNEDDAEYEYLPLPEVDEDYLDHVDKRTGKSAEEQFEMYQLQKFDHENRGQGYLRFG